MSILGFVKRSDTPTRLALARAAFDENTAAIRDVMQRQTTVQAQSAAAYRRVTQGADEEAAARALNNQLIEATAAAELGETGARERVEALKADIERRSVTSRAVLMDAAVAARVLASHERKMAELVAERAALDAARQVLAATLQYERITEIEGPDYLEERRIYKAALMKRTIQFRTFDILRKAAGSGPPFTGAAGLIAEANLPLFSHPQFPDHRFAGLTRDELEYVAAEATRQAAELMIVQ